MRVITKFIILTSLIAGSNEVLAKNLEDEMDKWGEKGKRLSPIEIASYISEGLKYGAITTEEAIRLREDLLSGNAGRRVKLSDVQMDSLRMVYHKTIQLKENPLPIVPEVNFIDETIEETSDPSIEVQPEPSIEVTSDPSIEVQPEPSIEETSEPPIEEITTDSIDEMANEPTDGTIEPKTPVTENPEQVIDTTLSPVLISDKNSTDSSSTDDSALTPLTEDPYYVPLTDNSMDHLSSNDTDEYYIYPSEETNTHILSSSDYSMVVSDDDESSFYPSEEQGSVTPDHTTSDENMEQPCSNDEDTLPQGITSDEEPEEPCSTDEDILNDGMSAEEDGLANGLNEEADEKVAPLIPTASEYTMPPTSEVEPNANTLVSDDESSYSSDEMILPKGDSSDEDSVEPCSSDEEILPQGNSYDEDSVEPCSSDEEILPRGNTVDNEIVEPCASDEQGPVLSSSPDFTPSMTPTPSTTTFESQPIEAMFGQPLPVAGSTPLLNEEVSDYEMTPITDTDNHYLPLTPTPSTTTFESQIEAMYGELERVAGSTPLMNEEVIDYEMSPITDTDSHSTPPYPTGNMPSHELFEETPAIAAHEAC